jgi:hypothetical protein
MLLRGCRVKETFVPRTMEELSLTWPKELDHISASSLKMACRCPEQWRQVYVKGRRVPPNAAMIAGSSDHAAIEYSMDQKVHTYMDLPVGVVQDKFVNEMEERVEEVGWADLEVKKGSEKIKALSVKKEEVGKLKQAGVVFVGNYQTTASPRIQPIAVEQEFTIKPPGLPVNVEGRIDLIADIDWSTNTRIVDRKRRGSFNKKPEPEWVVQGRIYQLAVELPHEWHITFTRNGSMQIGGDNYTIKPQPRWKSEKLLSHVVGEIGYFMQKYGPDDEWPARGQLHTWACGYCAFRDDNTCWAWKD